MSEQLRTSTPVSALQSAQSGEEAEASAMAFAETRYRKYLFQRESIMLNAPESSGVYGLFSAFWIYIGEADNIRARMLEHLAGDEDCIVRYWPSGFAFELVSPPDRAARHEYLVNELQPFCNGKAARCGKGRR